MTDAERQEVGTFLATYWFDREEDDAAIVREIVADAAASSNPKDHLAARIDLLRRFLDDPVPDEAKAEVIRDAAWRFFKDPVKDPLAWLEGILAQLQTAAAGA